MSVVGRNLLPLAAGEMIEVRGLQHREKSPLAEHPQPALSLKGQGL